MVVNQEWTEFCFSLLTTDGVTTRYEYDAAGRLVREGDKRYTYGYLDKVTSVKEGANVYTYDYHVDGQLAKANYGKDGSEDFTWDGLALIQRGDERFVNEPHIGGGNPVASSKGTTYFNDMLGTTVGSKSGAKYSAAALTAFGEDLTINSRPRPITSTSFYTGKPHVAGLGHAFLMRNYRASLGKWQTADPLGYPDGWNALAYCNNHCCSSIDLAGANIAEATGEWNSATMFAYYLKAWGPNHLDTDDMGFTDGIYDIIMSSTLPSFKIVSLNTILPIIRDKEDDHGTIKVNGLSLPTGLRNPNFKPVCWALGKGTVWMEGYAECSWHDAWVGSNYYRYYDITINFSIRYYDIFEDIFTVRPKKPKEIETPYSYGHEWYNQKVHLNGKIILE